MAEMWTNITLILAIAIMCTFLAVRYNSPDCTDSCAWEVQPMITALLVIWVLSISAIVYTAVSKSTTAIEYKGTYTLVEKDSSHDYAFILKDKNGIRYIVNVEKQEYFQHDEGEKLICSFTEETYRYNGESAGCKALKISGREE